MNLLRTHKKVLVLFTGLFILYFFTRLYAITNLPIFTDEAIYIRWAQIAHNDANWRFISLTDGKQPLFVWIAMVFLNIWKDPLLAGRMVSVIVGLGSLVGIFFAARELFRSTKIGLLSAFLYIIYPFSLLYDRLALYDSLVAMFMVWSLYFTILLVRYRRLDIALLFGMIVGGGLLTKSSASFALILLPFSLLLFPYSKKFNKVTFFKFAGLALVSAILAQAISFIMRLSPFYYIIGQKNLTFIYSFSEWKQSPFAFVLGNLKGMTIWLEQYMTFPFLLVVIAAFFVTKKYFREKVFLFVWFVVPFLSLAFFGKVLYPRYLLFMTIPLLILGAFSLHKFMNRFRKIWYKIALFLIFTISFIVTDYFILTNISKATIASGDKDQLVEGWSAGTGVKETVNYINKQAKTQKVFLATQGTFGLMPYSLEMYLSDNPNITIKGYWPIDTQMPLEIQHASKTMLTYVVFYQPCPPCEGVGLAPKAWNLQKVMQFEKGKGNFYTLYKVL